MKQKISDLLPAYLSIWMIYIPSINKGDKWKRKWRCWIWPISDNAIFPSFADLPPIKKEVYYFKCSTWKSRNLLKEPAECIVVIKYEISQILRNSASKEVEYRSIWEVQFIRGNNGKVPLKICIGLLWDKRKLWLGKKCFYDWFLLAMLYICVENISINV